jgi:hypothetical protein
MLLKRNTEILYAQTGDEVVMLDVETGNYHHLNSSASAIWSSLEKPRRINEVCDLMLEQFHGDRAVVHTEVNDFVLGLLDKKFLLEVPPGEL